MQFQKQLSKTQNKKSLILFLPFFFSFLPLILLLLLPLVPPQPPNFLHHLLLDPEPEEALWMCHCADLHKKYEER